MKILSIETSCDETGISLVDAQGDINKPEFNILEEYVASQIETHREWGGVVPDLAKREHDKKLPILFKKIKDRDVDLLTVTVGPGLDPCLWSGINFARDLKKKNFPNTELVGANHLEGHLYSFLLDEDRPENLKDVFPAVQLVVSGGHTILVYMKDMGSWEKLGETRDDAAGESFDKVARMLDLPYPGGPEIEKASKKGDSEAIDFPRPMINSDNYDFSFSGLKTAVLYYLRENEKVAEKDVAASFQQAVVDTLTTKTFKAANEYNARSIMVSGGVAANSVLRNSFESQAKEKDLNLFIPPIQYNTDNASIIAVASYINNLVGKSYELKADPNLNL